MFDSEEERQKVLRQLMRVRDTSVATLTDAKRVQRVATKRRFEELVLCLGKDPFENYGELLREYTKEARDENVESSLPDSIRVK